MVKKILKGAFDLSARALPASFRRVAFEAILRAESDPWWALSRVAPKCSLRSVAVDGSLGVIYSAPTDRTILRVYQQTGRWADRTTGLLSQFLGNGGQYIDIGANIGLTTIPIAKNPAIQCTAIEPDPTNFFHLETNIRRHCVSGNVILHQRAAYSHRETLYFELSDYNLGDHRIKLGEKSGGALGESEWRIISVQAEPIDALVVERTGPLAVKIDTQGAEPYVFSGGQRTLSRSGLIIMEWAPYLLGRIGGNPREVLDFLSRHFSTVEVIEGEDGSIFPPLPASKAANQLLELLDRYRNDPTRYFDLVVRK